MRNRPGEHISNRHAPAEINRIYALRSHAAAIAGLHGMCASGRAGAVKWVLVVVLGLSGAGSARCESMSSALSRGAPENDVCGLLLRADIRVETMTCRMAGMTRDAVCGFAATPGQAEGIATGLGMTAVAAPGPGETTATEFARSTGRASVLAVALRDGTRVRVWMIAGRPASLRTRNGSAFEFAVLYYDPARHIACLELSYAYG